MDGAPVATTSWSDTQIQFTKAAVTAAAVPFGPHQLKVTASNGKSTINGITFHRIGGNGNNAYNPPLFEVGPTSNAATTRRPRTPPAGGSSRTRRCRRQPTMQSRRRSTPPRPVPWWSCTPTTASANPRQNPRGAYYENLVISKRVKLQGVGPGSPDGAIRGSILDGGAFGGDSPVATDWYALVNGLNWAGNQDIFDGAVISLYLPSNGGNAFPTSFSATTAPSIDGFDIRGGDQMGFPGNINAIGGGPTGQPGGLVTQGGAIYRERLRPQPADHQQRGPEQRRRVRDASGSETRTWPAPNNQNDAVRIASNRIIANAGTNLAGGIGIFAGADGYVISGNDICGNFSAEYGGGVSVYGRSPDGSIDHNRIYNNQSYDEGGGIMIAGQLPTDPSILSPGSGAVTISFNLIQANLANDDGGGIRFLMAGNFPMNVFNNMIVNNVSTHEGGGIALDDAPKVRIYNNTIMKNVTTATAATSDGQPAPAGLSTGTNSALLQATLPAGSPAFSNPLLFNNIFWDNRAGTRNLGAVAVTGIGAEGDATPVNYWDIGVGRHGVRACSPRRTRSLQQHAGTPRTRRARPTRLPTRMVVDAYDTILTFAPWRTNPNFVGADPRRRRTCRRRSWATTTSSTARRRRSTAAPRAKAVPVLRSSRRPPSAHPPPTSTARPARRPARFDIGADEIQRRRRADLVDHQDRRRDRGHPPAGPSRTRSWSPTPARTRSTGARP